ncbi:hypothetical protein [Mesorhizobium sp. M2A.F.Ca.ET.017.03.2.1]|uniref:hypothetical protein n=1 Tax=unclassified Mesorhizobium TaxID=325217 RepID=UPI0032B015EA
MRIRFESVPLIECTPSLQQIFESGVRASFAEDFLNVTDVVLKKLTGEVQHERLAQVEFFLVRYLDVFVAVVDIVRQFIQITREFGMPIKRAGLLAQTRLMFSHAPRTDEFES